MRAYPRQSHHTLVLCPVYFARGPAALELLLPPRRYEGLKIRPGAALPGGRADGSGASAGRSAHG